MFIFKILSRVLSIILLIVIVVPLFVSYQIWSTANSTAIEKSDVIVVLGAAQFNGQPTPVLRQRINQAYLIYNEKWAPRIITVGAGAPGDASTEGATSYRSLVTKGVSKSHLTNLPIGRDTLSSTVAYMAYLKIHHLKSVIIVTDPFHCYRAIAMAKDLGAKAICSAAKNGSKLLSSTGIRYLIRETGAFLAYKTVDRIGIHLSDHPTK
jgi:vancomycin permeability regulator SanA